MPYPVKGLSESWFDGGINSHDIELLPAGQEFLAVRAEMSLSSHDGITGKVILIAGGGENAVSVVVASYVQPWHFVPPGICDFLINFPL